MTTVKPPSSVVLSVAVIFSSHRFMMANSPNNELDERDESAPLLRSDRRHTHQASGEHNSRALTDRTALYRVRSHLQRFLTSKYGHYSVVVLVSLDVASIFASFLISLHICENGSKGGNVTAWERANKALGALSLAFSSLFMAELLLSVFAFGARYFSSIFHIFDSLSIVASFLVDVLTQGPVKEAGSLVIVLRLFRVFKIIEESSTAAEETLVELQKKIRELEEQNSTLRQRQDWTNQQ